MELRFFLLLFAFLQARASIAQKSGTDSIRRYNNAVYLELGGPALIYSVGYERTWYQTASLSAFTSAGYSYIPAGIHIVYAEPGVLFRHRNLALELGLALGQYHESPQQGRYNTASGSSVIVFMAPRVGIRAFTRNQRFHFRAGFTPNIELHRNEPTLNNSDRNAVFWLNVFTLGYRF